MLAGLHVAVDVAAAMQGRERLGDRDQQATGLFRLENAAAQSIVECAVGELENAVGTAAPLTDRFGAQNRVMGRMQGQVELSEEALPRAGIEPGTQELQGPPLVLSLVRHGEDLGGGAGAELPADAPGADQSAGCGRDGCGGLMHGGIGRGPRIIAVRCVQKRLGHLVADGFVCGTEVGALERGSAIGRHEVHQELVGRQIAQATALHQIVEADSKDFPMDARHRTDRSFRSESEAD